MPTRPGYIWSGTEWVSIGQEAVVAPVSYQTSAPSSPSTGDIWIDSNDDVPGIDTSQFLRWRKTAVGGETSVSGTDDNGLTLQYTANYEQVYLNGVLQVRGQDYTATNGTSITGLTALAANDVVEVFGVVARVVGDVYTQAQADAKYSLQTTTGLVLLSTTTIGSAVASVTVNNAFNSSYDNYKIIVAGGTSSVSDQNLFFQLGASTTGYYSAVLYASAGTPSTARAASNVNAAQWSWAGHTMGSNGFHLGMDLFSPNLATWTRYVSGLFGNGNGDNGSSSGIHQVATAYTGFTITPSSGTLTGGTIKVYGYK